jgi:hypothetical protein
LLYQLSYAPAPKTSPDPAGNSRERWAGIMRFALGLSLPLLLSALATPTAAQRSAEADRWQVTLGDGRILWDVRLVKLEGESLHVSRGDSVAVVSVGQITEVRLIRKSEMRLGDGAAGAMAALTGSDDEVYDLTPLEFADRLRAVQKLFLYHPPDAKPAAGP